MDTNFSLYRIKHLLLADWIENKKSLLLGAGVLFIILISILLLNDVNSGRTNVQAAYFFIAGLSVFVYYCQFISKKVHKPKGIFYTLPANNAEKYLVFMLEGAIFFAGFFLIFWAGLFIIKLFIPHFVMIKMSELYHGISSIGMMAFLSSIIFLSYLTFRKHALLISFAGLGLYVALFSGALFKVLSMTADIRQPYFISSFAFDAFEFLKQYLTPALLVASVIILYIGYLKLKEKELR